jgi:hypothetical protein
LLDLPQDRGRRRLRHQHHGHGQVAFRARPEIRQRVSRARSRQGRRAGHALAGRRHFCAKCGGALWVWDPRWAEWVYPFASAIDTPLPKPPEEQEIMLDFAAPWCAIPTGRGHTHFRDYPDEGIADWHAKRGLTVK